MTIAVDWDVKPQKKHIKLGRKTKQTKTLRAIPEKKYWGVGVGGGGGKMAGDVFFYGWLVRKIFELYGSLVFDQI